MGRGVVIEPTDEMVQAFRRAWRDQYQFGIASQEGATRNGLTAVLALVERDLRLRIEAEAAAEREHIRQVVGLPFLAAIRCVPDGRIQNGCVVHDGKTVRERAKQAYLNAFDPAGRP
jgi:hypothetical protein